MRSGAVRFTSVSSAEKVDCMARIFIKMQDHYDAQKAPTIFRLDSSTGDHGTPTERMRALQHEIRYV